MATEPAVDWATAISPGTPQLPPCSQSRLPGGLLIGRVTAVHSREQDLFETVEVEPLTDYARLERVLILTDFLTGAAAAESAERAP